MSGSGASLFPPLSFLLLREKKDLGAEDWREFLSEENILKADCVRLGGASVGGFAGGA